MKHYHHNTALDLEHLKKHNKIFFDNAQFHGDRRYLILKEGNKDILRVKTDLTGWVNYEIEKNTCKLKYTHL